MAHRSSPDLVVRYWIGSASVNTATRLDAADMGSADPAEPNGSSAAIYHRECRGSPRFQRPSPTLVRYCQLREPAPWRGTRPPAAGRPWTAKEDALLGTLPDEAVARKTHRTVEAVQCWRQELRIAKHGSWGRGFAQARKT